MSTEAMPTHTSFGVRSIVHPKRKFTRHEPEAIHRQQKILRLSISEFYGPYKTANHPKESTQKAKSMYLTETTIKYCNFTLSDYQTHADIFFFKLQC